MNDGAFWVDWTDAAGKSHSKDYNLAVNASIQFERVVKTGAAAAQMYFMPGDSGKEPVLYLEHPEPEDD